MRKLLFFCFPLVALCLAGAAETSPIPPSREFTVTANGKPVFVFDTPIASLAYVEFTNPVDVVVETKRDLKWADVRPLRWGIRPALKGNIAAFPFETAVQAEPGVQRRVLAPPVIPVLGAPEAREGRA